MATESSKGVPIRFASRHVRHEPADLCISRMSRCALSLSPCIISTANGRCWALIAMATCLCFWSALWLAKRRYQAGVTYTVSDGR